MRIEHPEEKKLCRPMKQLEPIGNPIIPGSLMIHIQPAVFADAGIRADPDMFTADDLCPGMNERAAADGQPPAVSPTATPRLATSSASARC